jgi:synaptotagmin-like protein
LAGNELSKENVEKNMEWFVTPVNKEEKDYSGQEIQEPSIVKTRVLSIDYKDTLNDSLQKLLSEASLPAVQPSGGKVHQKQIRKPGVSENRTWPSKTDFTDTEEDTIGPKEITDEHVDKTVAPPKAQQDTLAASLDRLLKEATESSQSPLQPKLEPVFTRTNSQPKEGRLFEKEVKQNHNTSIHQREKIIPFPEGDNTLGNTALTQKAESGECQLNTENLLHASAEGSPLLEQAPHHHRKGSFEDVVNLPQDTPFYRDAHLAPQDRALPSQREISETVEKVILPSKLALNDVNAVLQRLFREAWLNSPSEREVGPGEVKAEFPEGVQTAGSPPNPLGMTPPWATVDTIVPERKDFYSLHVVPDKGRKAGSCVAAQMSPAEQFISSSVSTVVQYDKELPEEIAEIVRETVIEPKSECLKFSASIENY